MRYLVTGSCGHIGSHLCKALLVDGHDVVGFDSGIIGTERNVASIKDNPRFSVEYYDVCDKFDCGEVDGIFHLASPTAPAETYKHPALTLRVNSDATLALLEMANKYDAKFLFTSSIKVNDKLTFGSTYIKGKILGERFCEESKFAKIARLGNVYGPNMAIDDSRVIPTFIRNTIRRKPLQVWGDGTQVDSFCYVDDIIVALMRYMESDHTGAMEFGYPVGITISDLALAVLQVNAVEVPIVYECNGTAPGVVLTNNLAFANNRTHRALAAKSRKVPNISTAQNYLRWQPQIELSEGISKTTEYYKSILAGG